MKYMMSNMMKLILRVIFLPRHRAILTIKDRLKFGSKLICKPQVAFFLSDLNGILSSAHISRGRKYGLVCDRMALRFEIHLESCKRSQFIGLHFNWCLIYSNKFI